jgi:competence protein ComEC
MAHFLGRQFKFQVQFFDIGQGDATLIRFENGQKMLVDCGPDKKILNKLGRAMSFFDTTIDYLVVTHFDLDHYGGCTDVLSRYEVTTVITNGHNKPKDQYWNAWKQQLDNEHAEVKIISNWEERHIASTTLQFLAPFPELVFTSSTAKSNNYSIVFRLLTSSSPHSVLFTGDIEEPTERQLQEQYCMEVQNHDVCPLLRAQILKVPHHGSKNGLTKDFLEKIKPSLAIISVGKNNTFGHPGKLLLDLLNEQGVKYLRTDEHGTVDLVSDGRGYEVN